MSDETEAVSDTVSPTINIIEPEEDPTELTNVSFVTIIVLKISNVQDIPGCPITHWYYGYLHDYSFF